MTRFDIFIACFWAILAHQVILIIVGLYRRRQIRKEQLKAMKDFERNFEKMFLEIEPQEKEQHGNKS